jgi:flavin reductase (DIM6/NTAB) family NADH-FMN oxidoreductase RutF/rubredoxin
MDTMVLRNLSYGLFVIGTKDGERLTGCTVNSVIQATSDPVQILVCVNHDNFTNRCIKKAGAFSVSILSEETSGETIGCFGFQSGKDKDKFAEVPYELTPKGLPVLKAGTCGWLEVALDTFMDLSTHTVFAGTLTNAEVRPGKPMTYAYYHQVIRGKTPPKAPTFEKPREGLWTCPICGYQYNGSAGPFESLPESWACPLCKAPKSGFTKN